MVSEPVVIYERADSAAIIRINRPSRLNAMNREVEIALGEAFAKADADADVRALILTGTGRGFSVGADIEEFPDSMEKALRSLQGSLAFLSSPERVRKPVIAAVNGYALGGGFELAIACDIVIAARNASFGVPEPTLGVVPGLAAVRLAELIGIMPARDVLLSGRRLSADEALGLRLVSRVVDSDDLMNAAKDTASGIAKQAPLALEYMKHNLNRQLTPIDPWPNSYLFNTADALEGRSAFAGKRPPIFKGG